MEYPKRRHPRLKEFDYSSEGVYFITICTEGRQQNLCEIVGQDNHGASDFMMQLTDEGKIVNQYINQIPQNYQNVSVDHYVIMPDHIHLLLTMTEQRRAESTRPTTIPQIISILKRLIHKEIGRKIFQTSFYDHVIRDKNDYETKWNYIDTNPMKWFEHRKA